MIDRNILGHISAIDNWGIIIMAIHQLLRLVKMPKASSAHRYRMIALSGLVSGLDTQHVGAVSGLDTQQAFHQ